MVREGHAWAYRQYLSDQSLLTDEANAKEQGIGLWSIADPCRALVLEARFQNHSLNTSEKFHLRLKNILSGYDFL